MNQLERRLALPEIRQAPQAAFATVARDWLRNWDGIAPRLATTYDELRRAEENGATLEPLDASLLAHLSAIVQDGNMRMGVQQLLQELADLTRAELHPGHEL
jgi:hypothetical protein